MKNTKIFANISKVQENDDGTIDVFGIASNETVDSQGEIVTKEAMKEALPDYFLHGTGPLRAMHQPIAAGYVYQADIDESGNTVIAAKVVDPVEIKKTMTGVYKGFSIGGKVLPGGYDMATKKISKMRLIEISLVDRPANPEAAITMWKGDEMGIEDKQIEVEVKSDAIASVDALAELINKGSISPQKLIELAEAEIQKGKAVEPVPEDIVKVTDENVKPPENTVEKGMYDVSDFCNILQQIGCMASSAQWESEWEGDNSPIPAQLRQWLMAGTVIFQTMAAEEIQEMLTNLSQDAGEMQNDAVAVIEMSDKPADIEKAGARNSKTDMEKIQSMHDNAVALGAMCADDEVDKHNHTLDLEKFQGIEQDLQKITAERDNLQKRVKELEDQPAPPKATLLVIAKEADVTIEKPYVNDEPILKSDGSVDKEATALAAIKKLHQSGGQRLLR